MYRLLELIQKRFQALDANALRFKTNSLVHSSAGRRLKMTKKWPLGHVFVALLCGYGFIIVSEGLWIHVLFFCVAMVLQCFWKVRWVFA